MTSRGPRNRHHGGPEITGDSVVQGTTSLELSSPSFTYSAVHLAKEIGCGLDHHFLENDLQRLGGVLESGR